MASWYFVSNSNGSKKKGGVMTELREALEKERRNKERQKLTEKYNTALRDGNYDRASELLEKIKQL